MRVVILLVSILLVFGCKSNKNGSTKATETAAKEQQVSADDRAKVSGEPATTNEVAKPLEANEAVQTKVPFHSELLFGNWQIVSISENGKTADLPYSEWDMQLQFEEESETVGIKSPCNSGGCVYQVTERVVSIQSECGFTEMYCEEEAKNKWERKLVEILNNQSTIELLDEENLKLRGSASQVELMRL